MGSRDYKNFMGYDIQPDPIELRKNLTLEELKDSTPFPNPLSYEDIDREFQKWVEEGLEITYEGKRLPTMTMYSNQRFSEYMQSWSFTDELQNPILNFKSITRENNPKSGTINGETKNIPGEHTWLMKRVRATDKNGREYGIEYRMKQPFAVDLIYKISIFTNKYELLNKFNELVNQKFKAITAYIRPNGHYVSMCLNDISDDSEYSLNDRQYYSQSYNITVRGYIITEDSFIVHETPRLTFLGFDLADGKSFADVEIGGYLDPAEIQTMMTEDNECDVNKTEFKYRDVTLKVFANPCDRNVTFTMDMNFTAKADRFFSVNTKFFKIKINGETVCESVHGEIPEDIEFHDGDLVKICHILRKNVSKDAQMIFGGYTKDDIISDDMSEEEQYEEEVIVE